MRAPANLIAYGDCFSRSRNTLFDAMLTPYGLISPESWYTTATKHDWQAPLKKQPTFISHYGLGNRIFVDGHIEPEVMRKPFAATDDQLRRWNVDDPPHRELLQDSRRIGALPTPGASNKNQNATGAKVSVIMRFRTNRLT